MMEKCYDEGTLQAFLDNELAPELSQAVARHVADCDPCAILLAEVEEETALVFSALGDEFNTLVPTQRLWAKINQSIEVECRRRSPWQSVLSFLSGFSLTNPTIAGFASLLFVFAVVGVLLSIKPDSSQIATNTNRSINVSTPDTTKPAPQLATAQPEQDNNAIDDDEDVAPKRQTAPPSQYRIEKANLAEDARRAPDRFVPAAPKSAAVKPIRLDYLPGEETYVSTIARLESTVNTSKDEVLKPSARFSYEKNMAIVNDAIRKMKAEVRRNPKNEAAKQVLFASYQNKIDLLNSVTERSDLIANLDR